MTITSFVWTGAAQTYTVPAGVTSLVCDLTGASGAPFSSSNGGTGAHIRFTLAVTPGAVLQINVGGSGYEGNGGVGGAPGVGGFNGGASGGGCNNGPGGNGGGGASDIRVGGTALSNRVGVAAGGGAGGGSTTPSTGGGGGALSSTGGNGSSTNGGLGGTQSAGGAGQGGGGVTGGNGASGVGGVGASNGGGASDVAGGGGGGGGFWGGGGGGATTGTGANPCGGGGGSSWASGTGVSSASTIAVGVSGGNPFANINDGSITITTADTAPNAPTLTLPVNNGFADVNNVVLGWTFSDPDAGDTQSSADIRYRVQGSTVWTTLMGVVTGTASTYQLTGLIPGVTYEWEVRTYDAQGTVGAYSSSFFFTPKVSLFVSILTPTAGQPVTNLATTPFTFTLQRDMNGVVARRVGDNNGQPDLTNIIETQSLGSSAITSVTFTNASHNDGPEHWQIQVKAFNNQLVSQFFDVFVVMSVDSPSAPKVTATAQPSPAAIQVVASFEELSVDYFGLGALPTTAQTGQALTTTGAAGVSVGGFVPTGANVAEQQATCAGKIRSMSCAFRQGNLGSTTHTNNVYMIATDASNNAHIYCGIDAGHWYIKLDTAGTITTLASGTLATPITTSAANATPWFMWASFTGTTVTFLDPSGTTHTATNAAIGTFTGTIAKIHIDDTANNTTDDTWRVNHWAADSTANNVAVTGYVARSLTGGNDFVEIPGAVWDAEEYGAVFTYTDYTAPFNRRVWYQAVGVTATGAIAKSAVS